MYRLAIVLTVLAGGLAISQWESSSPAVDHSAAALCALSDVQMDEHLRFLAGAESDPAARAVRVARQAIGTPRQADMLGEGAYDAADSRPMHALAAVDSASLVQQSLAMAVSPDFESFFCVLQRLRYRGGQVATAERNHNLLADWAVNNAWLLDDLTRELADGMAWVPAHQIVRRAEYLQDRFGVETDRPDEKFVDSFIPRVYLYKVLPELRPGDVAMVITGNDRQQFCETMGLVAIDATDVEKPLRLIQAAEPAVAETVFRDWTWEHKNVLGYKFLRLRSDALQAAEAAVAEMRTRVTCPEAE